MTERNCEILRTGILDRSSGMDTGGEQVGSRRGPCPYIILWELEVSIAPNQTLGLGMYVCVTQMIGASAPLPSRHRIQSGCIRI